MYFLDKPLTMKVTIILDNFHINETGSVEFASEVIEAALEIPGKNKMTAQHVEV